MRFLESASFVTGAGNKRTLRMEGGRVLIEEHAEVTAVLWGDGGYLLSIRPSGHCKAGTDSLHIRSGAEVAQLFLNCVKRPRKIAIFLTHEEYRTARKRHPLGKHFRMKLDGWQTPRVAAYLYPEGGEVLE